MTQTRKNTHEHVITAIAHSSDLKELAQSITKCVYADDPPLHNVIPVSTPYSLAVKLKKKLKELGNKIYGDEELYIGRFGSEEEDWCSDDDEEFDVPTPRHSPSHFEITFELVSNMLNDISKTFKSCRSESHEYALKYGLKKPADQMQFFQQLEQLEAVITKTVMKLQEEQLKSSSASFIEKFKRLIPESKADIKSEIVSAAMAKLNPIPSTKRIVDFTSSGSIIESEVDIKKFPQSHGVPLTSSDCLVLGDLHANAMKFIYFLLHENIMIGINEAEYDELFAIYEFSFQENVDSYKGNDLDAFLQTMRDKLTRFNEITAKMVPVNPDSIPHILLVGDVLADRGKNDYFTLKFLQHLNNQKLFPEILYSNHDKEFLEVYENGQFSDDTISWNTMFDLSLPRKEQGKSAFALGRLIQMDLIDKEEVLFLIEQIYLPLLNGIALNVCAEKKEIASVTHAPVPIHFISRLAKELELPRDEKLFQSPQTIVAMVDAVNAKLKDLIKQKKLVASSAVTTALYDLVWQRSSGEPRSIEELPENWTVVEVHGHDGEGKTSKKVNDKIYSVDLDNMLGKTSKHYKGEYTAYYIGNNAHFLEARLEAIKRLQLSSTVNNNYRFWSEVKEVKSESEALSSSLRLSS